MARDSKEITLPPTDEPYLPLLGVVGILEEVEERSRLLRIVKCRKLRYFGHVVRAQNLCTSILHGHIDGTRPRGTPSTDAGQTTSGSGLV